MPLLGTQTGRNTFPDWIAREFQISGKIYPVCLTAWLVWVFGSNYGGFRLGQVDMSAGQMTLPLIPIKILIIITMPSTLVSSPCPLPWTESSLARLATPRTKARRSRLLASYICIYGSWPPQQRFIYVAYTEDMTQSVAIVSRMINAERHVKMCECVFFFLWVMQGDNSSARQLTTKTSGIV